MTTLEQVIHEEVEATQSGTLEKTTFDDMAHMYVYKYTYMHKCTYVSTLRIFKLSFTAKALANPLAPSLDMRFWLQVHIRTYMTYKVK